MTRKFNVGDTVLYGGVQSDSPYNNRAKVIGWTVIEGVYYYALQNEIMAAFIRPETWITPTPVSLAEHIATYCETEIRKEKGYSSGDLQPLIQEALESYTGNGLAEYVAVYLKHEIECHNPPGRIDVDLPKLGTWIANAFKAYGEGA